MARLREIRADETRAALLRTARSLFSEHGYAGTSTEAIVTSAGVTRGALYHHFRDKRDVFRAVFEQIEGEFVDASAALWSPDADPWTNLRAGCAAFLDSCVEPDVQRIVLLDGPSVLGWDTWREIEEQYALASIGAALKLAMRAGMIPRRPVMPLAHLVLAAINEAGLLIAQADDPTAARRDVGGAFDALLDGLRTGAPR